jgi:exocyst complex component 2
VRREGQDLPIPPFVPPGTTVLTACHFAERLVEDLMDTAGDLMVVDVGSEAVSGLKNTLDSLRWRLEEVIASLWTRGKSARTHYSPLAETHDRL